MLIPDGYELIAGRGRDIAQKAIALADERDIPTTAILSTADGYLIPKSGEGLGGRNDGGLIRRGELTTEVEETVTVQAEEVEIPTASWKKDDIIGFAERWKIDLGDAKNNDERVAAINAEIERRSAEAENGNLGEGVPAETNPEDKGE
jgi:hypothetical protein